MVLKRKADDQYDRDLTLAWSIELMHRQKKLPALDTLLKGNKQQRKSVQEHKHMVHILSQQYGGQLRTRKKGKARGR